MLLTNKLISETKQRLFNEQKGICPLCGRPLDPEVSKNHLDHDHDLTGSQAGRVRGLLHPLCNVLEGRIRHQYKRSGIAGDVAFIEVLKSLVSYLEQDNSGNAIHPQLIPDLKKRFARLDKQQMIAELTARAITHNATAPKAELISIYSKAIKHSLT